MPKTFVMRKKRNYGQKDGFPVKQCGKQYFKHINKQIILHFKTVCQKIGFAPTENGIELREFHCCQWFWFYFNISILQLDGSH